MKIIQIITDYIQKSILTTQGDMAVRGVSTPERLAGGALKTILSGKGAGVIPAFEAFKVTCGGIARGQIVRSTSGDEIITGIGFTPAIVFFLSHDATSTNLNFSWGYDNGAVLGLMAQTYNGTNSRKSTTRSISILRDALNDISGWVSAISSDGFTVTFSLIGVAGVETEWFALG